MKETFTKEICERLTKAVELSKTTNYEKFPLDYLNEITESANRLYDASEEELVAKLRKNKDV